MSDFRVVDKLDQFPGEDMLCLSNEGGPFLDLGRDFDDVRNQGRIYLRVSSVIEMGKAVGMVSPDEVAELKARLRALETYEDNGRLAAWKSLERALDRIDKTSKELAA